MEQILIDTFQTIMIIFLLTKKDNMELPEYLRLVANRLDKADKPESIRLIKLLVDTLKETLEKYDK